MIRGWDPKQASCSDTDAGLTPMTSLRVVSMICLLVLCGFDACLMRVGRRSIVEAEVGVDAGFRGSWAYRMVLPVLRRIH